MYLLSSAQWSHLCMAFERTRWLAHGTGDDYLLEQVTHYGSQLPMYIVHITGKQNSRDSRLELASEYILLLSSTYVV